MSDQTRRPPSRKGKKLERLPNGVADQLLVALLQSGETMYTIGKNAGVDQASLSRFTRGSYGMSLSTFDKLCQYLGLRLARSRPKAKE